ncbi:MAG: TetR/AcrR family transcriptional regulator [Deltaproteobacteria bacterium]|jgi:TetR/AcrR family transcriptional regulator, cholesterol catabolism regulator|nr:TetR/AcrR family transcriptional regulator [Deltaproteobacteria bacterium]MBT4265243.1 TetR/AcrR family transcriptional regulator [Deltaproteobacteria bacterium]MBT4639593.1 TetR/AcrR family transcriptional regulator [Deltaproteobacteria bacterium]MBT6503974.1 TetR/AcrR family transcriptional regulator [Deltaproteobacteria bacterium]MBT7153313.1 TetR/AcrR family transcriptional regulator [Deltaproteobacteria bacterium]
MQRKKTEIKKERIAQAATDIFIGKGYKNTSLQDIALTVGITKAGIYHYFKTKEEILYYILSSFHNSNIDAFQKVQSEIESPDLNPTDSLKIVIRAYAKLSATKQNVNLLSLREMDQLTGINKKNYRKIQQEIFDRLRNVVGQIPNLKTSLDLNTVVFMIISMSAWFGYWLKTDGKLTLEEAIEQSIDIICHGVME